MEKFNYDNVSAKMNDLSRVFSDLMQVLDTLDAELNDNVSIGDQAAIHGVAATQLLNSWNSCSDTFVDFKSNLQVNIFYCCSQKLVSKKNFAGRTLAVPKIVGRSCSLLTILTATPSCPYCIRHRRRAGTMLPFRHFCKLSA
jgi:hypothetical protein